MPERIACSATPLPADASTPPTEFRLFKTGLNETAKGAFLWDASAARETLARFQREGVDLMIDLEHESLADPTRADSRDARGWCQLAERDGELWAINVRWTPDGARRLAEKTQRYISPVVERDPDTKRVLGVFNLALCAMPATYGAQALVAASRFGVRGSTVLRSRVTIAQAERFERLSKGMRMAPGQLVRALVVLATRASKDPAAQIRALAEFLGLPADSTPEVVQDAVRELADEANAQDGIPAGASATDPLQGAGEALTKEERAYCTAHKLTAAQFVLRKQKAVTKKSGTPKAQPSAEPPQSFTQAELALLAKENIPPGERRAWLAARKAKAAVRRGK